MMKEVCGCQEMPATARGALTLAVARTNPDLSVSIDKQLLLPYQLAVAPRVWNRENISFSIFV